MEAVVEQRKPELFELDLPDERLQHYLNKGVIAVDTETRGLNIKRDRLCLVQISDEDGLVSFVRYQRGDQLPFAKQTNLRKLMEAPQVLKVIHFARFDIAVMKHYLHADVKPFWCTKIASKLVRTYTDRHSLKDLSRELLGLEMDKTDQMSDWAKNDLTDSQLQYAANDVRYLIPMYRRMKELLEREGRLGLAERAFECLNVITDLDLGGWSVNVFEH